MIDKATGALQIASGCMIEPGMTRADFVVLWNSDPCSMLHPNRKSSLQGSLFDANIIDPQGRNFRLSVVFLGERLYFVDLSYQLLHEDDPDSQNAWWKESSARRRKQLHDAILNEWLGDPPYDYSWGRVHSAYFDDGRSRISRIQVLYGAMSFVEACREGDLVQVQAFLAERPGYLDAEASAEALCAAAFNGQLAIAALLMSNGFDVNAQRWNEMTPLNAAIENMDGEMIEYLLRHGAAVNRCDSRGQTPLHQAVSIESEVALNSRDEVPTSAPITALLLAYGADVNAKTQSGETPLDFARHSKHTTAEEILLAHGALAGTIGQEE